MLKKYENFDFYTNSLSVSTDGSCGHIVHDLNILQADLEQLEKEKAELEAVKVEMEGKQYIKTFNLISANAPILTH